MKASKKVRFLLCILAFCFILIVVSGFLLINRPNAMTELRDSSGMLIPPEESELKEQETILNTQIKEETSIDTVSVFLDRCDTTGESVCATVLVDGLESEDQKANFISKATNIILLSDLDVQNVAIFDAQGNQIN